MDRFSILRWGRGRIKLTFKRHTAVLSDFAGRVVATVSLTAPDRWRSMTDIGAVGLGLPGIVDMDSGLLRWSSLLHDVNVDLVAAFAARFDMPLFTDNDTNMLTLAEL